MSNGAMSSDEQWSDGVSASPDHSPEPRKLDRIPTLKLHLIHGGPSQCRAIEPLADELLACVASSTCQRGPKEDEVSVTINDNCLHICCADTQVRIPLLRFEVHKGPLSHTLLLKSRATATGQAIGIRAGSKPVPVEVLDGETYICRGCLHRGLRGFRCHLTETSEHAACTVQRRPMERQLLCPKCASQGGKLNAWLLEVDLSDIDEMGEESAMQLVYNALAQAGASRTDLNASFEMSREELGSGANAVIYRARQKPTDKHADEGVAVKFINAGPLADADDEFSTIAQEVLVLAALQGHPNISGFHGLFRAPTLDKSPWPNSARYALMIDFYSGGDLWDAVKTRKFFSEDEAAVISRDLMSALAHVHARGFVHRDVKLENIMLASDNRAILVDFGLACLASDKAELRRRCGSAGYSAPEIIEGSTYDESVDVFAAGVVIFATTLGTMPFAGANTDIIFERTMHCRVSFNVTGAKKLSSGCKNFLRDLLRKKPEERLSCKDALAHAWLRHDGEDGMDALDERRATKNSTCSDSTRMSERLTCASNSSQRNTYRDRETIDSSVQENVCATHTDEDVIVMKPVATSSSQKMPKTARQLKDAGRHRFKALATKRLPAALGAHMLDQAMGKPGVAEMTGRAQTRKTNLVALDEEPELDMSIDNINDTGRATAPVAEACVDEPKHDPSASPFMAVFPSIAPTPNGPRPAQTSFFRKLPCQRPTKQNTNSCAAHAQDAATAPVEKVGSPSAEIEIPSSKPSNPAAERYSVVRPVAMKPEKTPVRRLFRLAG